MLFIEIQTEFNSGCNNIIKYRNIDNDNWFYMYIDIETLNSLIENFGIISTIQFPTKYRCADNLTTGKEINLKYCGANIKLYCGNYTYFYLPYIEQNY